MRLRSYVVVARRSAGSSTPQIEMLQRRGQFRLQRFNYLWPFLLLTILFSVRQLQRLLQFPTISSVLEGSLPQNDISSSAFVSLATIPEEEKKFTPGVYKYGRYKNASLIITGASITSEYNSPQTLWFQFFALGDRVFDAKSAPNYGEACHVKGENKTVVDDYDERILAALPLKPWDEMKNEGFLCRVGTRAARFELMPSEGFDPNTNRILQIWRCPLAGVPDQASILPSSDVNRFLQHHLTEDMALAVDIVHREGAHLKTVVAKIYLPLANPHVGLNQVSDTTKPFSHQRHDVTLCVVAQANALVYLNEFVRYHYDEVGIDHIHMGLETDHNGNAMAARAPQEILRTANRLLRPEIDAGKMSISVLWDEDSLGRCVNSEIPKQIFYQNCLYSAKSTSEFVATWDIDEYFSFREEAMKKYQSLPGFLRGIHHPTCQDWSYVTMESAFGGGSLPGNRRTGLVALDYPSRENKTNNIWQKSIARTKYVLLNSFHIPGSSLPQGKSNSSDAIAMAPGDGECAFYTHEAIMIHVKGIMYRESPDLEEPVPNELQSVLLGG